MILIALGGNIPAADRTPAEATVRGAARALDGVLGLRLVAVSACHATPPDPPSDQPDYLNMVARLEGEADPAALLAELHRREAEAGRVRTGVMNLARPLDLDLIEHHGLVREAPPPVLPHPRAHARAFVLVPLAQVAPDWRHPILKRSAAELLAHLDTRHIRRLPDAAGA